jgi:hypothetical protein
MEEGSLQITKQLEDSAFVTPGHKTVQQLIRYRLRRLKFSGMFIKPVLKISRIESSVMAAHMLQLTLHPAPVLKHDTRTLCVIRW